MATIGTPVWRQYVANKDFQEANAGAIQAERADQAQTLSNNRQAEYDRRQADRDISRRQQTEVWKGANGKLLHKVGGVSELLDPADYTDHPVAGGEARKSLWQRDVKSAKAAVQGYQDQLDNPALQAGKMSSRDYEMAQAEQSTLEPGDARYKELDAKIQSHKTYVDQGAALKQKHWEATTQAHALEQAGPEAWHAAKQSASINANRGAIVQDAQEQHAAAGSAAESLAQDQAAMAARLAQGVKGSELAGVQAQQAQMADAQTKIDAGGQAATAQLDGVKKAAADQVAPGGLTGLITGSGTPAKAPAPEGITGTIMRSLATKLPGSLGTWAGTAIGTGLGAAAGVETGPGLLATGVAGGIAGGTAIEALRQHALGPNSVKENEAQMVANAKENPLSSQFADMASMLVGFMGGLGKKVVSEGGQLLGQAATKSGEQVLRDAANGIAPSKMSAAIEKMVHGAAGFAKVEGSDAAQEKYVSGKEDVSVLDRMAKGTIEGSAMGGMSGLITKPTAKVLGALGLFDTAKKLLWESTRSAVTDTAAMQLAGDMYDTAVHGKEFSLGETAKRTEGGIPAFLLQNLILGAFHSKWRPSSGDKLLKDVNDHLASIDPTHAPATEAELEKSHQMFGGDSDPAVAAQRYADGVLIHRQLTGIEAEDTQAVADAQANLDGVAAGGGDKAAVGAAQAALDTARANAGRGDLVRGVMKIASGQSMVNLKPSELTQLGLEAGKDDKGPTPLPPDKLKANGLTEPLVYEGADGSPIITDKASERVKAISPEAHAKISMDETQARRQAQSRADAAKQASTVTPDGAQGDPATGDVLPHEIPGAVDTPSDPATPATPAAEAVHPDHVSAVKKAVEHIKKIVAGNGVLKKAIVVESDPKQTAQYTGGKIHINPDRIIADALKRGMKPEKAHKYFKAVLDEEIKHLSEHKVKVAMYHAAKSKGETAEFRDWSETHARNLLDSDFKGKKLNNICSIYTYTKEGAQAQWDAKTPEEKKAWRESWDKLTDEEKKDAGAIDGAFSRLSEWDNMSDSQKLSEAVRIRIQERADGSTEGFAPLSAELRKYIKLLLHSIRALTHGNEMTLEMAKYVEQIENVLKESNDPQEAPAQENRPAPTPEAGAEPPPSQGPPAPAGAGPEAGGLKVGDKVAFHHPGAGGDAKGVLEKISDDGKVASVSSNGVKFNVRTETLRGIEPETKPEVAPVVPTPAEVEPEMNPEKKTLNFTSRKEAVAWMKANGIQDGHLTKIDSELFRLEVPAGNHSLPWGWYKMDGKFRYTTSADPDAGFGLSGPYTRAYVTDMEGLSSQELSKMEKAAKNPTPLAEPPHPQPNPNDHGNQEKASAEAQSESVRQEGQVLKDQPAGAQSPAGELSESEQALRKLDDELAKGLEGLFAGTLPEEYDAEIFAKPIPHDRFDALLPVVRQYIASGVDSPEKLAERLRGTLGGKLVPFSQSLWGLFKSSGVKGPWEPEWKDVHGAMEVPEVKTTKPVVETVTPPAPVVKEAKEQAKKPDTNVKKFKAQKEYLLAALDKAFSEAESTPLTREQLDAISEIDENWIGNPYAASDERYKVLSAQRAKVIEIFNSPLIPKIEIEVPGDGTFRIVNTKSAIAKFREKAKKKFPTTALKSTETRPGGPLAPTSITPIGNPKEVGEFQKIAAIATTKDETRYVLKAVHNDGENIVATDGRRALVITRKTIGSNKKPVNIDPKTLKPLKDKDGNDLNFPNWRQMVPTEFKEEIPIDTAVIQKIVIQAAEMTSDRQESVYLWRDASGNLGLTSQSADVGMYAGGEVNPDSAKFLVALNGGSLNDGLTAMRRLGFDKVTMQYTDEMSPVVLVAPSVKYVLMPMRVKTDSALHPLSKAAEEAEAKRQAELEAAHQEREKMKAEREEREAARIAKIVGEEEAAAAAAIEKQKAKAPNVETPVAEEKPKSAAEPKAEDPAVEPLPKAIIDMLLRFGHEAVPSGPQFSGFRQLLMDKLTGKKSTKADSGVIKATTELAKYLGVDIKGNVWGASDAIKEKLREMRDGEPSPTVAEKAEATTLNKITLPNIDKAPDSDLLAAADQDALHTGTLPKHEDQAHEAFYSHLGRTVEGKVPNNANPAQIMATLPEMEAPKLSAASPEWKAMSKDERLGYLKGRNVLYTATLPAEMARKTPGLDIVKGVGDGVKTLLLPAWKSKLHLWAAELLGAKIGEKNRHQESTTEDFRRDSRMFDKLGVHRADMADEKNPAFKFMSDMSTGRLMSPAMDAIAKRIAKVNDIKIQLLKDSGAALQSVRENYFPGVWTKESREAFNLAMKEAKDAGIIGEEFNVNSATAAQKAWVKAKVGEYLKAGKGSVEGDALAYLTRNPIHGKESFRKRKVFDEDIMTAIEFGLKPVSNNPLDLMKLKWAEMDQSILANKFFQSLTKEGKHRVLRLGAKMPEGWQKVNDKYGDVWGPREIEVTARNSKLFMKEEGEDGEKPKWVQIDPEEYGIDVPPEGTQMKVRVPGRLLTGQRIVPDAVGDVLNNYLSKSAYNNQYFGGAYKAWMGMSNALNMVQLGLSAFHAGFMVGEAQVSSLSNVMKDVYGLLRGNRSMADVGRSIGNAVIAVPETFRAGSNMKQAWQNEDAVLNPKYAPLAKAFELAGMGLTQDKGLITHQHEKLMRDFYNGHKGMAALRSPMAAMELMAMPIMKELVPRMKAGVFAHLAQRIIDQNSKLPEGQRKTLEQLTPEFRQAGNRVDARMGQVRYDRLFMNNVAKNVMQALIRAPGWSGGTIAEVGGSMKDTLTFVRDWSKTGKLPQDMPDRVAYTLALLVSVGAANAALTYLFTGEKPDGLDYAAFRTGGKDAHGRPSRMLLPTYAKDILAYGKHPVDTLLAKTHPMISLVSNLAENKDYFGTEIRHPGDGAGKQALDVAKFAAKTARPFAISGVLKEMDSPNPLAAKIAPMLGITPAPKRMTQTPAEEMAETLAMAKLPKGARTQQEADASREKYAIVEKLRRKEPVNFGTAIKNGYITLHDIPALRARAGISPLAYQVKKLDIEQAEEVYSKANTTERKELKFIIMQKKIHAKDFSPLKENANNPDETSRP